MIDGLRSIRDSLVNFMPGAERKVMIGTRLFNLRAIVTLAQMAVFPNEPSPDTVRYGEWTTLGELPVGALFENKGGGRWIRSDSWNMGGIVCVQHGGKKGGEISNLTLENVVRQIHLPEFRKSPEPPSWDERVCAFLADCDDTTSMAQFTLKHRARQLLAEKEAQEAQEAHDA